MPFRPRAFAAAALLLGVGCAAGDPARIPQDRPGTPMDEVRTDAAPRVPSSPSAPTMDAAAPSTGAPDTAAPAADAAADASASTDARIADAADGAAAGNDARDTAASDAPGALTVLPQISYPENIRRTMSLLASSTAESPNEVRVLAFGQSISDSNAKWVGMVRDWLTKEYPNAKLVMETRGEGGCAARCLLGETADRKGQKVDYVGTRAIPFKAHLIIFHVYGAEEPYERVVTRLRESGAEVLIQSDHVTRLPLDPVENTRNTTWLAELGKRRGVAISPVWQEWGKYLRDNRLQPSALLSDSVHPNDRGWRLIADIHQRALSAARVP